MNIRDRHSRKRSGYLMSLLLSMATIVILSFSGQAAPQQAASTAELSPDTYLTRWLVLGPISVAGDTGVVPDEMVQRQAFETDPKMEDFTAVTAGQSYRFGTREYQWRTVASEDQAVDLNKVFAQRDYAFAYAWTEVTVPEERSVLMAVGSDDGVKVWVNGELVHENWTARALQPDEDLFAVHFRPGKNRILLKVQDIEGEWGFSLRPIGPEHLKERLVRAAGLGDLEQVNLLLDAGVDVNATVEPGLTALHSAKIHGRQEMATLLVSRGADTAIPMPDPRRLADTALLAVIPDDVPGVAVLVARNGEVLYAEGFGLADLENKRGVTPHTKFRIGSVTKQFTAAAILKMQEQGMVNVRDHISQYLPDYPRGDEITIHHLLTHTSGVHSFTEMPGFMESVTREKTPAQMVEFFRSEPLDFTPGDAWHYSNSGYFLLGYLVEQISGESYAAFIQDKLLAPAGMAESGVHQADSLLTNVAYGYSFQNDTYERALNWHMSQAGGAGAIYSTAQDLYRWNEAIFNGKILDEKSLRMAFTPVVLNNGQPADAKGAQYGYGWMISSFRGMREISHSGGLQGFVSYLMRLPEIKATVVVLHNCAPTNTLSPDIMAHDLAEYFFWEELASQSSFAVSQGVDYAT
ncbi:MAG: serine hydrolase, partial [Calditrichota bacterium]